MIVKSFPENFIEIGRFGQPHGLGGEINFNASEDVNLHSGSFLFVDVDSTKIPLKIITCRQRSQETFLLRFQGYETSERINLFRGLSVWGDARLFESEDSDSDIIYLEDLNDYKVFDSSGRLYGTVIGNEQSTENALMIVERIDGTETYIPFVEAFVTGIEPEAQSVHIDLPDGFDDNF